MTLPRWPTLRLLLCIASLLSVQFSILALTPSPTAVFARVVDVGAGLACVIVLPDGRCIIYDAGNYQYNGRYALGALEALVPTTTPVELLILSHTDADHVAAVPEILNRYDVRRVIRAGMLRDSQTWNNANNAIVGDPDVLDINLAQVEFPGGATYRFGDVFVTVICGFSSPPEDWDVSGTSELRNAGSIVVRITYAGSSILLCGDAVGRHNGQVADESIATELHMLQAADVIPIRSQVLVAPHHGADNGSSSDWIRAVDPDWVIFSAGHRHEHPRAAAAQRYLNAGVPLNRILRTDRGDWEGDDAWDEGGVQGETDPPGDDSVDVLLHADGNIQVAYADAPVAVANGFLAVGSVASTLYHFSGCADAERIRDSNLIEFTSPPADRRLHSGCPR